MQRQDLYLWEPARPWVWFLLLTPPYKRQSRTFQSTNWCLLRTKEGMILTWLNSKFQLNLSRLSDSISQVLLITRGSDHHRCQRMTFIPWFIWHSWEVMAFRFTLLRMSWQRKCRYLYFQFVSQLREKNRLAQRKNFINPCSQDASKMGLWKIIFPVVSPFTKPT